MHPVWEKIANAVEKDFEKTGKREVSTRRMLAGLLFLAAVGLALIGTGYMLTSVPMSGTYCEFDSCGR